MKMMNESLTASLENGILREIYRISESNGSPIAILSEVIAALCTKIGAESGRLSVIDELTGEETAIASFGEIEPAPDPPHKRNGSPHGTQNGRGGVVSETGNGSGSETARVPVRFLGKTIGLIDARKRAGTVPFTENDLMLIGRVGNLAALLVDNVRLGKMRDRNLTEISELMEISGILNSSLDPSVVREKAITVVTRLLECEVASLLLVDEATDELYFEVALGEKGNRVKEIRLKKGEGIAGWVAAHNQPLLIDDVKNDPRHSRRFDERSKFETRNMICVPMAIKEKVVGVLQAINKLRNGGFSQADLDLFISLSHEVAIAVDNARLYNELRETFYQTAEALADAIEKRDPYTGNHTRRVMHYSMAIARFLDLTDTERENLRLAAILHDIGKIGVEDSVLQKDSELNNDEYHKIMRHPEIGVDILGHIRRLEGVIPGIQSHHERIDGKGYPLGIRQHSIPLIARIISVADTFDAMTTDRPYRAALSADEAVEELKRFVGSQFDRAVVDAFIKSYENGYITKSVD
jgi:putative nucleotidyltransferase with HDIG domain